MNGSLSYTTGEQINTTYSYNDSNLLSTVATTTYTQTSFSNHYIGYYLGLGSALGFIGVIFSLSRSLRRGDD